MRYDAESNIIKIHLSEFVSIARRGISPSASYDEDEPNISELTKNAINRIICKAEPTELCYRFNDGGWDMELSGSIDNFCDGCITMAKMLESSVARPNKQEMAQARG